jgi:hypothetical protein
MKKLIALITIILGLTINSFAYITINSDITSNTTWTSGNTYFLSSSIEIINSTLTIEDGVVVKFSSDCSIVSSDGTLNVNGQSTSQVIFTSMNDDSVGEIIAGSTGNPAPNDWTTIDIGHIIFEPNTADAHYSYTEFRYGDRIQFFWSTLTSSLDHVDIHHFESNGLYLSHVDVTIDHVDISYCETGLTGHGISTSTITNLSIADITSSEIIWFTRSYLDNFYNWNISARED